MIFVPFTRNQRDEFLAFSAAQGDVKVIDLRAKQLRLVFMINLRKSLLLTSTFVLLSTTAAHAQYAPVPKKAPRTPVSKELLSSKTAPLSPSTLLQGTAKIVDTERLRIDQTEVRLFGVVPPLMGASYGPQARAVLDSLAQGTVTCQIKDRTRDGHYLAMCSNEAKADFGLELLRRGLAASARGSLTGSPYEAPYQAAEAAAQNQKLGIWSASMPAAASESSIRSVMTKAETAKVEAEKAKKEAEAAKQEVERAKAELAKIGAQMPQPTATADTASQPSTVLSLETGANVDKALLAPVKAGAVPDVSATPTAEDVQAVLMTEKEPLPDLIPETRGFFERYQLLLSSVLVFGTTIILAVGFVWNKFRQKKEDMRSIAAALHGELMAARSVCVARLSKIALDGNDATTSWPRIRTIVFQAYIGKLGCLGAVLSRQIASVYGMASDYASYYNTSAPRNEGTSKHQALRLLVKHIEEITPRLSQIEKEGKLPAEAKSIVARPALKAPTQKSLPLSLTPSPTPPSGRPAPESAQRDQRFSEAKPSRRVELKASMTEAKAEIVAEAAPLHLSRKTTVKRTAPTSTVKQTVKNVTKERVKRTTQTVEQAAQAAIKAVSGLNLKAPIIERLSQIKSFTTERSPSEKKASSAATYDDFSIPDYANLTEEELEALLYAEEEMIMASPVGKWKQVG